MGVKKKAAKRYLAEKEAEDEYWRNYEAGFPIVMAGGLITGAVIFLISFPWDLLQ